MPGPISEGSLTGQNRSSRYAKSSPRRTFRI